MPKEFFTTELLKTASDRHARSLKVVTPHGEFTTPAFMPVGTRAFVNCLSVEDLTSSGSQIILGGNTYHMLCRPGLDVIEQAGGMHRFMNWSGPMLTDSGGYQAFSLSKNSRICKIDELGAHFKHPDTGQVIHLTPLESLRAQKIIGADIIMAFDQCTPNVDDKRMVEDAMQHTHRWLKISKDYHDEHPNSVYGSKQVLFGIIQGGSFKDLRLQSAAYVVDMDLDGIAIGGEAIGYDMPKTLEIIDWIRHLLPENKLRYTMGVGLMPQDLIDVVTSGIDIFDCVAPTRNARHGALYCGRVIKKNNWIAYENIAEGGRILIKKSQYANDFQPIVEECGCHTCQHYTRAYLHHLFKTQAALYYHLACIHNVFVMHDVCRQMRECILGF